MKAADVMETVVADLVAAIEEGAGTWAMPWRQMAATGVPTNAVTHKRYTGGNAVWFALVAQAKGYPSPRWATYKQWASVGAQVRKGERGTPGIYWNVRPAETIEETDPDTGETVELTTERVTWARSFTVFNAAQVDNATTVEAPADLTPLQRIERAEAFFAAVPAVIGWGTGNPSYWPAADRVVMPAFDAFDTPEHAYGTLAHELGHWTGHPSRLNRTFGRRFGDNAYAAEELVAELTAAFTCALLGIDTATRTDHAAYLASWCQMLRARPSTLWTVASKAQAATDHLAACHADHADIAATASADAERSAA